MKRDRVKVTVTASKAPGAPWPKAEPPVLGELERAALVELMALRSELAREPEPEEVASRLGLRDVRPLLERLDSLGLLHVTLTRKQSQCLTAISTLEQRLGRSPSTTEVSTEMGLSPAGSRFHIASLVSLGLVTRPKVVLVLAVTPLGRAFLPS